MHNKNQKNYLWFIMLTYAMVLVLANWFDPRLIHIFGLDTDAGTIIFPFTFLLSNLITEVYGYKNARLAIWCGFLFNMIFIFYGELIVHLPSPNYPTNNANFDILLSLNTRIIIASAISYLCAEPLNSIIMAKLKVKTHGKKMGLRFIVSTIISGGFDSLIFGTLAFYGLITNLNLFYLILSMWLIKSSVETLGLPISITLARKLKELERTDIYDRQTNFKIFSLDAVYTPEENEFEK